MMHRATAAGLAALAAIAALATAGLPRAVAAVYAIRPGEPNLIRFESKAPVESFAGTTRQVQGTLEFNPESLADTARMVIEVNLASLDTGINLRNRHMRENHLETDTYPSAVFRIRRLAEPSAPALLPGSTVSVTAVGTFELHGVAREIEVPAQVAWQTDDPPGALRISAKFPVRLSDYNISRPQFLVMRLDEVQRVTVELLALPQP